MTDRISSAWIRDIIGSYLIELVFPEIMLARQDLLPYWPNHLDADKLVRFSVALSEDNPLFVDPAYGPKTRWGCQIAPPTVIIGLRYPHVHVGVWDKPFRVLNLVAGFTGEWVDVFRAGDTYRTNLGLKENYIKPGGKGDLLFMISEGGAWNQDGKLIAKQNGAQVQVGAGVDAHEAQEKGTLLYDRVDPYRYSKKEIGEIEAAYDAEIASGVRGSKTLYWEDVNEGDKLPKIVRGPLTHFDLIGFNTGGLAGQGTFKLPYKIAKAAKEGNMPDMGPSALLTNPATNWPYESDAAVHVDMFVVRYRGLPLPFDYGAQREEMWGCYIADWMGDDGFLRRLSVQIRKPNQYGDTSWINGEVVKKYKVNEGGVEYGAVDIKIDGTNQLGEMSTPGTATVYLPSPSKPVVVPIPVKLDVIVATEVGGYPKAAPVPKGYPI